MGANSTQAQAVALFLAGFTSTTAGFAAGGSIIWIVLGLILIGVASALFIKCKPWEHTEE
jgi:hypothetical protein